MCKHPLVAVVVGVLALLAPPAANAEEDVKPFGTLDCVPQEGVRFCEGSIAKRVRTFDGVPLDVNVALPAGDSTDLPLIVLSHGWGGSKHRFDEMKPWAEAGYAVLAPTARGFGHSCGSRESRLADPAGCAEGWIHLDDTRYGIRDVQVLAGLLADQGIVDPQRVGVHGGSYGGGVSLAAATLRDRVMLEDGTLVPWRSPGGRPMRIAAAAPSIPWSDLVYALVPNGRTLDYAVDAPRTTREPTGVLKQSFVAGLYATGQTSGYYAPPGADPEADLHSWYALVNAGEPYDGNPLVESLKDQIARFHSAAHIPLDDQPPAPTFISNGWTDDIFPADEAIRWYNRVRSRFPGEKAEVAMMHFDYGHQRGQNRPADRALYREQVRRWMDHHVKGDDSVEPLRGVHALRQVCDPPGATERATSSGDVMSAPSWPKIHPGEVRGRFGEQSFTSVAGDPGVARAVDPIAGGGACARVAADDEPGTVNYRLPAATGDGYTLLGSPTVIADLEVSGPHAQVVGRLWDVDPQTGEQTLVARTVYRPDASGRQVFQLHPNAWTFEPGHVAKLQLLGRDAPYARPSNGEFTVTVKDLELRLPVHDRPARHDQVSEPAPVVMPDDGREPAPGVEAEGSR